MEIKSYHKLFPAEEEKISGESRILMMTLPSIVEVGEEFLLKVVMMNVSGMPDEAFRGKVNLNPSAEGFQVPECITFGPRDHGGKVIPRVVATEPGAYYVEGEVEGSPSRPPRSNPTKAQECVTTRLFWGDIHVHTVFSNCNADYAKDPAFGYWYAREVSHLDFAAATDHLRGLDSHRWARLKEINEEYNKPSKFVTLLGFESSHSKDHGGDINVYYLGGDADYFWLDREDMKGIQPKVGLDVLWDWLDRHGEPFITIPHHTGRAFKYRDFALDYYDHDREPVLEIFSQWGSSEARHDDFFLKGGRTDSKAYFQDALELGYKYGVIGSSDNHHTMPGTPCSMLPTPYHHPANKMVSQGLAAVYARDLSRQSIFHSIAGRSCYATTSTRPILSFSVNDASMGQTIAVKDSIGPRRITVDLCSSLLPASIDVLCNNEVIHAAQADAVHTMTQFVDDRDATGLWTRQAPKNERPFFQYYARIKYRGRHAGITAWSSPIWVEGMT